MWWNKKKLQKLLQELASIAMLGRLYAIKAERTLEDHYAEAMRHMRQADLLVEIEKLTATEKYRAALPKPKPALSPQEVADLGRLIRDLVVAVSEREGKMRGGQASSAAA